MITPEIREIQVFLALIRTGSFSAAAKDLGITQPAVSAHISKLEQTMGFPLFHRCPEGTSVTEHGHLVLPHLERVDREYHELLRRAEYWKRAQSHEVKIWTDGGVIGQELRRGRTAGHEIHSTEIWRDLGEEDNWINALKTFDTDIVLAGSYLKAAEVPGIRTSVITVQPGLTVAWNPDYYAFDHDGFSFPDTLSSSIILPTESLAIGFRDFLFKWCETTYGIRLVEFMEFRTDHEAVEACKLGLGVMIFPGDVASRMNLGGLGLASHAGFGFLLPKAFTYGIRWRANEQNPQIITTVQSLIKKLISSKQSPAMFQ